MLCPQLPPALRRHSQRPGMEELWPGGAWRAWGPSPSLAGSDCKPAARAGPPSGCGSPDAVSPPLTAEDEVFLGSMAVQRAHASPSPDPGVSYSSTEDLLSIDAELQGSEYYKDLGLDGPTTSQDVLASVPCPKAAGCHYLDRDRACSCVSGGQGGLAQEQPGLLPEAEKPFLSLVQSTSTSRWYSWKIPVPPTDKQRRLSLDASELESDTEQEDGKAEHAADAPPPLPQMWSGPLGVGAELEPLPMGLGLGPEAGNEELGGGGKRPRSKSVPSPSDSFCSPWKSPGLEVSLPVPVGTVPPVLEIPGKDPVPPELMVQQVLKELTQYHGPEDDEKNERGDRGAKVKRRLSNLRSRVTGSWQKDKGKTKEQHTEAGETEAGKRGPHGHVLAPGAFGSHIRCCSICGKTLSSQTGPQCLHCGSNPPRPHKAPSPASRSPRSKHRDLPRPLPAGPQTSHLRSPAPARGHKEHPRRVSPGPNGNRQKRTAPPPRTALLSAASAGAVRKVRFPRVDMDDSDGPLRVRPGAEDAAATTESIFLEDGYLSALWNELEADAREFRAHSWSLAVEQQYMARQDKETVRRQEVIYELIRTEVHHVRTLKILLKVYAQAMREALHFSSATLQLLFPCAEDLLGLHEEFLSQLKLRRMESREAGSACNYLIRHIGDLLVRQFSGETGNCLKEKYGVFCSRYAEAVGYYKELLQRNKKFQDLMKKLSNATIVRRLGVQECILLVTQRIMKYPVLVERVLQNTEAGTPEHAELTRALALIKEAITAVDSEVSEAEKGQRLRDILARMDLRPPGKGRNGQPFPKEELARRRLLLDGTLFLKASSGRLKEVLAVLLSDVLLLLQEKDQKYSFANVDGKAPVVPLQGLIAREAANDDRGLFLIGASARGHEMYELLAGSREERHAWMGALQRATAGCPDEECPDSRLEEERRQAEARAAKLQECRDRLGRQDALILQLLGEKRQTYQQMAALSGAGGPPRPQVLLCRALEEAEGLQRLLLALPRREDGCGAFGAGVVEQAGARSFKKAFSGDPLLWEHQGSTADSEASDPELPPAGEHGLPPDPSDGPSPEQTSSPQASLDVEPELVPRVQIILELLLSLQAALSQEDSRLQLQRCALADRELLLRQQQERQLRALEEAEAQRRREEAAARGMMERVVREREELEQRREAYQRDLERLREAQRAVERERGRLEELGRTRGVRGPSPAVGQAPSPGPLAGFDRDSPERAVPAGTLCARASICGPDGARAVAAPKGEVPIQLLSATNQLQAGVAVQQQIPTKLAASTREKGGRSGRAAAEPKQSPPTRRASKEDPQPRGRAPTGPPGPEAATPPEAPAAATESGHPDAAAPPSSPPGPWATQAHAPEPALGDAANEAVIFL
ncbi:rho guanine nucleotide exchange factor 18-like isoform X2 [Varanus komodoensis]|uniref:rho guanine nucleotide exchange factor 18-like isoform X2 n=1 Tax=Varanus komodoensis TaxID=61221 RepID=UPI001CF7BE62|nr:rho guanine nucleotide exchange factor 18-like isoform X2 [Varanus komodoensis]